MSLRLNKFLAERLGVSRREADELIATGKVIVNNKMAVLGDRVDEKDKVCYNNKTISFETNFLYLALNKPVGYVTTAQDEKGRSTVLDLVKGIKERIVPVRKA